MAWIMKNSAGEEIDRRPEPYLSDEDKAHLEKEVIPKYPVRKAASLPVLHEIQHKHGYIPQQAMEEAAQYLQVTTAELNDTATFYDDFFLRPKGKYLIGVCESISCELRGSEGLIAHLEQKLGISEGQTTEDGRFTLRRMQCLGSCGSAPCCLVEEDLHENLTLENADDILDKLE